MTRDCEIQWVADSLGVSRAVVDALVSCGMPHDMARDGSRRFDLGEVDEWVAGHPACVVAAMENSA